MVKVPKIRDMIASHPLLGALPDSAHDLLVASTKEVTKPRGMTIYKEGARPNGIWLISNGNVKWSSKTIRNRHALHPTFTHGTTLGLYEVLVSKPYICDMTADSVVFCFFIEADKILRVFRSDSEVEDFMWKESIIVLSKILAPRVFEKLAVQDLRLLISERSRLTTYLRGETIEIQSHAICILLEGFVKSQYHDLITPPAVLCPMNPDTIQRSQELAGMKSGSNCYLGFQYTVQTRAKIIILDMASLETDKALRRKPSTMMLATMEHSSANLMKQHSHLMSWPEKQFEAFAAKNNEKREEGNDEKKNLSARAMQLSMYGSMVDMPKRKTSFKTTTVMYEDPSHSMSFPSRPPVQQERTLSGARSEGPTTLKGGQEGSSKGSRVSAAEAPSDDDSGGEDVIVRIDSPSNLSFRKNP